MSTILHIETSTQPCSVTVSQDGAIIYQQCAIDGPQHSTLCGKYVSEGLSFIESHAIPLDAVSVSIGPGSYTGLRIGLSTAKGVCFGRGVPLLTVPTLEVMAVPVLLYHDEVEDGSLLCPMIDARRMEVYCAVYDRALHEVWPAQAHIVEEGSFAELLDQHPVYFFGNGAEKCKQVLRHPNARFIDEIVPLANNMLPLAERKLARGEVSDVAYTEPFYLKEFEATKPRNLI